MKYRKKPVVIEATQWFKEGDHPAVTDIGLIATLEGTMQVTVGEWIDQAKESYDYNVRHGHTNLRVLYL